MTDEQKIMSIFSLIMRKTYPKDQLGFYSEQNLIDDITSIIKDGKNPL